MAAPTDEEKPILLEFRRVLHEMALELSAENSTDIRLLAWLRARDLKVPEAAEMLKKSLEWRKENNMDQILQWEPPLSYAKDYAYKIDGRDADGRPILVIKLGQWDVRRAITSGERETWLRNIDQMFAKLQQNLREISVELGREVTQFVAICDTENFSHSQLLSFSSVDSMMEAVRRLEGNNPETIYRVYIINSSKIWQMAFELLKRFMTKRTVEKFELFTSPAKWKPRLLEVLPPSQIPKEYGGLR